MDIEFSTIGERGQIVIPKQIREETEAPKGTTFGVIALDNETIVMKKIDKSKLLKQFRDLRASIKAKLTDKEILDEIKGGH